MPRGIPSPHAPPNTSPGREIELIEAAREYYTSDPPPFLSDFQKPAGLVNKAFLASEGTRALGPRVSVMTRAWSSRSVYQTIDLDGKREIVKLLKGGPRGCFYRRWMGVIAGFEKQPIAYPVNEAREAREARGMKEMVGRYSLPGDDSESLDLVTSDAKPAIAKPASGRKRKSLPSFVDYSGDKSEDEFGPPKRFKRVNSTAATMNPPKSGPSLSRASVASRAAAPQVKIKQEPGAPKEHTSLLQPANTSSVGSQVQASISNLSSRPTPPSSRDKSNGHIPKSKHPSTTTTTTTPSSSSSSSAAAISIHPPEPEDKFEELISNFLSSPPLTTTTTTTTSSLSQTDAVLSSSSSLAAAAAAAAPVLSLQKQATTILSVYLNPGEDYVPVYLRSCMTISRFFASCLGAFELDEQPETVSALRVRLEPIPTTTNKAATGADEVGMKQQGASWLVKRAVPDSFEIFLEAVNKWAGWKDRESCAVRVEIILRAKK